MLSYIIISTLIVSAFAFIGLIAVYKKMDVKGVKIKWIISLAAGALLSVSFFDLLPEAVESGTDPHNIFLAVFITFLAFFVLERILHWHHCHHDEEEKEKARVKHTVAWTNLFGDAFHNLIDGFLIASAYLIDTHLGMVTTLAVILHEIPQEISDFGVLLYAGYSRKRALFLNFLFALTVVLGGIAFYYFGQAFESAIPYMTAIAAGTFIYLAAADLIPELHHEKDSKQVVIQTIWLFIGVALMFGINSIVPHEHGHDEHGHETEYASTNEKSLFLERVNGKTVNIHNHDYMSENVLTTIIDLPYDSWLDYAMPSGMNHNIAFILNSFSEYAGLYLYDTKENTLTNFTPEAYAQKAYPSVQSVNDQYLLIQVNDCLECEVLPPIQDKFIFDTFDGSKIDLGKITNFQWIGDGTYRIKKYTPISCDSSEAIDVAADTPIAGKYCVKNPDLLSWETGMLY